MVFPKEVIDYSVERHRFLFSRKRRSVYSVLIILLVTLLLGASFVSLNIYATAQGMLRSEIDNVLIRASETGIIDSLLVNENDTVEIGTPLLILNKVLISQQLDLTSKRIDSVQDQLKELNLLIDDPFHADIHGILPAQQQQSFISKYRGMQQMVNQCRSRLDRDQILFSKGVISKVEMENTTHDYEMTRNRMSAFQESIKLTWQEQIDHLSMELTRLYLTHKKQLYAQRNHTLFSPAKGSLFSMKNCRPGLFVKMGDPLMEISTDAPLIAEVYVSSDKIGFLKVGQSAIFILDIFKHNRSSKITGRIKHIPDDIILINNRPVYKVTCELEASGKEIFDDQFILRKGMNLRVQFLLKRSSLYEILWHDADQWMPQSYGI